MATDEASDAASTYRPVSPLAVAALAAGCGSALVLITPLAAMLPLVAIALAAAALAGIRRSEGRIVGRWIALAGLALAVGFTSQAIAAAMTARAIARHRAEATARAWVEAVRAERLADAIAVSSPRSLPMVESDRHGPPLGPEAKIDAFRELPAVRAVMACTAAAPVIAGMERVDNGWVIRLPLEGCGMPNDLVLSVAPQLVTRRGRALEEWLVNELRLEP